MLLSNKFNFTAEFKDLVDKMNQWKEGYPETVTVTKKCKKNNDGEHEIVETTYTRCDNYIGFGNPASRVLIIGNECGHSSPIIYDMEVASNVKKWKDLVYEFENKPIEISMPDDIDTINAETDESNEKDFWREQQEKWKDVFCPIWPYNGLDFNKGFKTYDKYQDIRDAIYGKTKTPKQRFNFWEDVFISELSSVSAVSSGDVPARLRNESIIRRLENVFSHPFFGTFDKVIITGLIYLKDLNSKKRLIAKFNNAFNNVGFGVIDKSSEKELFKLGDKRGYGYKTSTGKKVIIMTQPVGQGMNLSKADIEAIAKF